MALGETLELTGARGVQGMQTMEREIQPSLHRLVNEPEIVVSPHGEHKYKIEIYTSEEAVAGAVELIHMLLGLNERLARAVKNTSSQARGMAKAQVLHQQQQAIADLYREHLQKGYKKREALERVTHSALAQKLGYTKADVGYCVRAFPVPVKVPQELPYKDQVVQGLDQVRIMSTEREVML